MGEREACLFSPVAPAGTWIKHCLSTHVRPKHSLEEGPQSDHWSSQPFCTRKRLVVALLVILALVIMMLLLLLNYYCIMVWHLCQHDESVLPIFKNTTPELDKQDWDVTHFVVFVLISGAPIWDAFICYSAVFFLFFVWWTEITLKFTVCDFSVYYMCDLRRKLFTMSGYSVSELLVLYLFKWFPRFAITLKIMPVLIGKVTVFIHLFKSVNLYLVKLEI